jgi:hypothetical protein
VNLFCEGWSVHDVVCDLGEVAGAVVEAVELRMIVSVLLVFSRVSM